jgi:cobalamin biosynthesis protein CobD/CbiB
MWEHLSPEVKKRLTGILIQHCVLFIIVSVTCIILNAARFDLMLVITLGYIMVITSLLAALLIRSVSVIHADNIRRLEQSTEELDASMNKLEATVSRYLDLVRKIKIVTQEARYHG